MTNKPLKRKYPSNDSDSRNTSRGRDSILTGATKKRVDTIYNTIKDEDGLPTGFSTKTKTVYKRVNRDLVPVRTKTKRVSDSRSYGKDAYAPQVQKTGGKVKKYQTEGPVVLGAPRKTRLSVVSPSGDYRTTTKTKNTPNSFKESSRTRRTIQGALKGVPKVNMSNAPVNDELPPPSGSFMKRGGSKKPTTIKKKK